MSIILGYLSRIKLTLGQYVTLALAVIVGLLALILSFKERELKLMKLKLLQSHFDKTDQLAEIKAKTANDAFDQSLRRLNDFVSKNPDLFHDDSSHN